MPESNQKQKVFNDLEIGAFFTGNLMGHQRLMVKTTARRVTVFAPGMTYFSDVGQSGSKWPVEEIHYVQFQTESRLVYEEGVKRRTRKEKG
jgi:hypothetical protein